MILKDNLLLLKLKNFISIIILTFLIWIHNWKQFIFGTLFSNISMNVVILYFCLNFIESLFLIDLLKEFVLM